MAFYTPCYACQRGDHDNCMHGEKPADPDMIGGWKCVCESEGHPARYEEMPEMIVEQALPGFNDLRQGVCRAPWTFDQQVAIIKRQRAEMLHPYTCLNGCGSLEVTSEGLACLSCDYKQDWVHAGDAENRPYFSLSELFGQQS